MLKSVRGTLSAIPDSKIMEAIKVYKEFELENPSLVAAWPGMGGVAIVAAKYLKEKLGAEELGEIEPYDFFSPSVVSIKNSMVEEPEFPESKFFVGKSGAGNDLMIFTGDAQPPMKGYRFANLVLDVAQKFKVERIYTLAAAPTHIYHTRKPRVLGVATEPELASQLEDYGVNLMGSGGISGMNGLLLGVAKERNMKGVCLLGEIPVYITQIANPKSSKAVLEVLTRMLDIEIDMTEIDDWARKTDEEVEEAIEHLKESGREEAASLIDYFERLKQKATTEETEFRGPPEELFKEIERFLKGRRGEDS